MEIEARDGQSVYLRGWGDYQRYCLKLTESDTSGMAVLGAARLEPRGARAPRRRRRGGRARRRLDATATSAAAPRYRFRDPDGHVFELYYEVERYDRRPSICGRR